MIIFVIIVDVNICFNKIFSSLQFKEIVKSLSANGNSVIDVDDIDPDVDTQLEAFGVELLDQATLDEMYGEAEVYKGNSWVKLLLFVNVRLFTFSGYRST